MLERQARVEEQGTVEFSYQLDEREHLGRAEAEHEGEPLEQAEKGPSALGRRVEG
jgi:hypothetical protein